MSDEPEESFTQAIQFGKLFVESPKWDKIEKIKRDYAKILSSLSSWAAENLSSISKETPGDVYNVVFRTATLQSIGYTINPPTINEQLDQEPNLSDGNRTKIHWHSPDFDDVRSLTRSSTPLSGRKLRFAYHSGMAVYVCYGKLLLDFLRTLDNIKGESKNKSLNFYFNVNYPMLLGSLNQAGKWTDASPTIGH